MFKKLIFLFLVFALIFGVSFAEEENNEHSNLIVITDTLNGRFRPNKKASVLAEYEFGDILIPTGKWSKDHMWVQVLHPEEEYVWVNVNYISERLDIFEVYTLCDTKVRIRKSPGSGKTTGYLKKEQHVEVDQVVLGFGHTDKGWIDLSYFIEEVSDSPVKNLTRK